MSKGIKHIDELFRDKLNSDVPEFRDEFWQGFEQALNNLSPVQPGSGGSAPSDGGAGAAGTGSSASGTAGSATSAGTAASAGSAAGTTAVSGTVSGMLASGIVVKGILAIGTIAMISTAVWFGVSETQMVMTESPAIYPTSTFVQDDSAENQGDTLNVNESKSVFYIQNNFSMNPTGISEKSMMPATLAGIPDDSNGRSYAQPYTRIDPPAAKDEMKTIPSALSANPARTKVVKPRDTREPEVQENRLSDNLSGNSSGLTQDSRLYAYSEEVNDILAEIDSNIFLSVKSGQTNDNQQEIVVEPISADVAKLTDTVVLAEASNQKDTTVVDSAGANTPVSPAPETLSQSMPTKPGQFGLYLLPGAAFSSTFGNTGNFKSKTNASLFIGAGLEFRLNKHLAVYLEPGVHRLSGLEVEQNTLVTYTFFTQEQYSTTIQNRELEVLSLPLYMRFNKGIHTLSAGPSLLYLISASGELEKTDMTPAGINMVHEKAVNYISGFNRTQLGLSLEYSLNVFRQHAAFIRFTQYLTGVSKTTPEFSGYPDTKLRIFYVGFRIKAL